MVVGSEVDVGDDENGEEEAVREIHGEGCGKGKEGGELEELQHSEEEGNEVVNVWRERFKEGDT